jgi:hypothetical protein
MFFLPRRHTSTDLACFFFGNEFEEALLNAIKVRTDKVILGAVSELQNRTKQRP